MMNKENVLVIRGDALKKQNKTKLFEDITLFDFNLSESFHKASIVIFVDYLGKTKIIKNRFGDDGNIMPNYKIERLTNRYTEAEKFIYSLNWLERIFISRKRRNFLEDRGLI